MTDRALREGLVNINPGAVELFAGIGGFRLAADPLGVETIWANDIDVKACKIYRDRFGGTSEQLCEGDIRKLKDTIPHHDVLTAGFPCQPFSSAGKKAGTRDPRGTLFQVVVEIVSQHSPRFFVLENVKRLLSMEKGAHFATILDALTGLDYIVEWRLLNAMHFGLPQNRQRVFIIGRRVTQESDKGASDIYLCNEEDLRHISLQQYERYADKTMWTCIESHAQRFPEWGIAQQGRFFACEPETFTEAMHSVPLESVLENAVHQRFDFTATTRQWIHKNRAVDRFVDGVEIISNQNGGARMGYTIFGVKGVAPTLTATASRHYERYKVGSVYRRLTNVEYARIQGFPDDHCSGVSVYDQYALYGNAVPPPMARWVLQRLLFERAVKIAEPTSLFNKDSHDTRARQGIVTQSGT